MIEDVGGNKRKPKNYTRNVFICLCECPVYAVGGEDLDKIMVKYEIEPSKDKSPYNPGKFRTNYKYNWQTMYRYWGTFKRVVELSPILNKMNDNEYIIKTSTFTRDNVQVPFIWNIEILNVQKYNLLKVQLQRKGKLKKIING